jgi:hypothetical protein
MMRGSLLAAAAAAAQGENHHRQRLASMPPLLLLDAAAAGGERDRRREGALRLRPEWRSLQPPSGDNDNELDDAAAVVMLLTDFSLSPSSFFAWFSLFLSFVARSLVDASPQLVLAAAAVAVVVVVVKEIVVEPPQQQERGISSNSIIAV